jgi:hypothetical protein
MGTRRIGVDQSFGFHRELVGQLVADVVHLALDPRIGGATFGFLDDSRFRHSHHINARRTLVRGGELFERAFVIAVVDDALKRHEVVLDNISQNIALLLRELLLPPFVRDAEPIVVADDAIEAGNGEVRRLLFGNVEATKRSEQAVDNSDLQGRGTSPNAIACGLAPGALNSTFSAGPMERIFLRAKSAGETIRLFTAPAPMYMLKWPAPRMVMSWVLSKWGANATNVLVESTPSMAPTAKSLPAPRSTFESGSMLAVLPNWPVIISRLPWVMAFTPCGTVYSDLGQ